MNPTRVWFIAGLLCGGLGTTMFCLVYFANLVSSAPPKSPSTPSLSRAWPERLSGAKSLAVEEGQTLRLAVKGTGEALVQFTAIHEDACEYRWRYFPLTPQTEERREEKGGGTFTGEVLVGVIRAYAIELDWTPNRTGRVWVTYPPTQLDLEVLDAEAFETLDLRAAITARPPVLPGRLRVADSPKPTPAAPDAKP